MSFHDRSKPPNVSKIVLPITPMLDMTFQLLFFFIVNFHPTPTTIEGQIDMALPAGPGGGAPRPVEEPVFEADLTVKVRPALDNVDDGEISALFLMDAQGKVSPLQPRDGQGLLDALKEALIAKRAQMPDGGNKTNVKVQAGGKLKVKNLLLVMDVCRQAGFPNASMTPPEDFGR